MDIYIVKTVDYCSCEEPCNCRGFIIDSVWSDEKDAIARGNLLNHELVGIEKMKVDNVKLLGWK